MTRRSPLVRRLSPLAGLLLVTPVLASCGFDYATNRVNTISMDASSRGGTLDAIGVVLVSAQEGSGTLIGTYVNQDPSEPATVEEIAGTGSPTLEAPGFEPIEVAPLGRYSASEGGVTVEGDFVPGNFVPVELTFGDGSTTDLSVPVVPACRQWEGLDESASTSTAPTTDETASAEPSESASAEGGGSETTGSLYECELPTPYEH